MWGSEEREEKRKGGKGMVRGARKGYMERKIRKKKRNGKTLIKRESSGQGKVVVHSSKKNGYWREKEGKRLVDHEGNERTGRGGIGGGT